MAVRPGKTSSVRLALVVSGWGPEKKRCQGEAVLLAMACNLLAKQYRTKWKKQKAEDWGRDSCWIMIEGQHVKRRKSV